MHLFLRKTTEYSQRIGEVFRKNLIVRCYCLVLLLLFTDQNIAQGQDNFQRVGIEYGSIFYHLSQDSLGQLWAATEEGVVRYNSQNFYRYDKYEGLPEGSTNRTLVVFTDRQNQIWLGAETGVVRYDRGMDRFVTLPTGEVDPLQVRAFAEDAAGNLWVGGFNGLFRQNSDGVFELVSGEYRVRSLLADGERLLVGTENGLLVYGLDTEQFLPIAGYEGDIHKIFRTTDGYLLGTGTVGLYHYGSDGQLRYQAVSGIDLSGATVRDLEAAGAGEYFVATDGNGLLRIDKDFHLLQQYTTDEDDPNTIPSNGVYDLHRDGERTLWIATYGGGLSKLSLVAPVFEHLEHLPKEPNSLPENFVRTLLEDAEGNRWFGTRSGLSVVRPDGSWQHLSPTRDGAPVPVMSLTEDGDHIWVGTYGRGAVRVRKNDLQLDRFIVQKELPNVYAVHLDPTGNLWLGGIQRPLQRLARDGSIKSFRIFPVREITDRRAGGIWVTGRNGLTQIMGEEATTLDALTPGNNGLNYTTATTVYERPDGELLLGTNGNGLLRYRQDEEQPRVISQRDGLPSDVVQGMVADDLGRLWVSTSRGLARVTLNDENASLVVFDRNGGLRNTEFNFGSYARFADGQLAFGGTEGITLFYPSAVRAENSTPRVTIERLRVLSGRDSGRKDLTGSGPIELRYDSDILEFQFAGVSYEASDLVRYSYRMIGMDDRWSEPTADPQLTLTNLESGLYTFEVRATIDQQSYSEPARATVHIAHPWWRSWWAYTLYVLAALAAIGVGLYVAGVLLRQKNTDDQIAFFNNITHELKTPLSILLTDLEAAGEGDAEHTNTNKKVQSTVRRLNTLFDQLLNFNKVTSGHYQEGRVDRLLLHDYIATVIENFKPLMVKKNLTVEVEAVWGDDVFYFDKNALDKVFFNLISNAVKYSRPGGVIILTLAHGGKNELIFSVADNGIGIPEDQQHSILKRYYRGRNAINSQLPGTGLGLMIVKNLVDRYGGSISFASREGEGTTFTVRLKSQESLYMGVPTEDDTPIEVVDTEQEQRKDERAKLLVVEDNDELRRRLAERLSKTYLVHTASNGREGLERARELFPDLILTDLIMPEMDGQELCRALRDDINLNHIPVFMMTVLNSSQNKIESIESGVTAYMEKPLDFDFLLAKISSTLGWQQKMRERYVHQTEMKTAEKYRNKRDADFINGLEKFVLEKVQQEGLAVHDLCAHVGMSRTALYMKLKSMVDLSPQEFIIITRLKFARQMLMEDDKTVKEVAYDAGFSNPKYFSTSFKKLFGESPSSYRKNLQR